MTSNDKTVPPPAAEAASSMREENVTMTLTFQQGLTGLSPNPKEMGKREEVLQKAQVDGRVSKEKGKETVKEKAPTNRMPPSPATHTHRYAMEVWIQVESSPGVYAFP